jgi:hypothetical protein
MSELTRPARGKTVLQMLGGGAITIGVLLPLYLIDRQGTRLAILKLEMELAHAGASAAAKAQAPAPASAPDRPAIPTPVVVVPSPPPSREAELAQVTRALSELAKRVEEIAPPGAASRAAEVRDGERPVRITERLGPLDAPPASGFSERSARLTDLRVKVYYESRCLGLASEVSERLIAMGANPEPIETRQSRTGSSRLIYMGEDQAAAAATIADGLSTLIPVDIEPDTSGAAVGGPRLELTGVVACQRPR